MGFAVTVGSLGKLHLSRHMLDEVLIEQPEPYLLPHILIQQSVIWRGLGSSIAARAFIEEAGRRADRSSPRQLGWIEHQRGLVDLQDGDYRSAERCFTAARRLYRRAKDRHQELLIQLSVARLRWLSGRPREAVKTALEVERAASRFRFHRTKLSAQVERARNLLALERAEEARSLLRGVLAEVVDDNDQYVAFHAHYYLWKAEAALGNTARASIEEREARYYLRFVDQNLPEAAALREGADRRSARTPSRSSARRSR